MQARDRSDLASARTSRSRTPSRFSPTSGPLDQTLIDSPTPGDTRPAKEQPLDHTLLVVERGHGVHAMLELTTPGPKHRRTGAAQARARARPLRLHERRATRRRDTLAYWLAVNPERVIACAVGPGRCARTRCAAASQPTQADHPPPRQTLRHPERSRRSVATRTSGSRVMATSPRRIVEPAGAKPRRSQKRGCSARSSGTGKSCGQYAIVGGCRPRCGDWGAG